MEQAFFLEGMYFQQDLKNDILQKCKEFFWWEKHWASRVAEI